jgi:hypothetical protein
VTGFHEATRVRLRAEDDHGNLLSALRHTQQRGQAVAGFADESGLAGADVHVARADELVHAVDRHRAAACMNQYSACA